MCRYAFKTYKEHFACFACRKMFRPLQADKLRAFAPEASSECPECKRPMKNMGLDFKAPRQRDVRSWRALEEREYTFFDCGCGAGFKPNLRGVEKIVRSKAARARKRAKREKNVFLY